jgi:hypothetical protein
MDKINSYIRESTNSGKKAYVGFDVEWDAFGNFRRRVATIQISFEDYCCVIHIPKILTEGKLPTVLKNILENKKLIKCGVRVRGDIGMINSDFMYEDDPAASVYIPDSSVLELTHLALERGVNGITSRKVGLKLLVEIVLEKTLPKPQNIRTSSDWWNPRSGRLSKKQVKYAALDAIASYQILMKILEKFMSEDQKIVPEEIVGNMKVNIVMPTGRNASRSAKRAVAKATVINGVYSARKFENRQVLKQQVVVNVKADDILIPGFIYNLKSNPKKCTFFLFFLFFFRYFGSNG